MADHGPFSAWRRRLRDRLRALLTEGMSPDRLSWALAVGTACSLFPFLGFTALLNLVAGWWLRLNQPLLQTLNHLLGPLQIVLIVPYVRVGEWLWGRENGPFAVGEMLRVFREASVGEFLERFAWAGVHALTAWAATAPLLIAIVYHGLRPMLRRQASGSSARA